MFSLNFKKTILLGALLFSSVVTTIKAQLAPGPYYILGAEDQGYIGIDVTNVFPPNGPGLLSVSNIRAEPGSPWLVEALSDGRYKLFVYPTPNTNPPTDYFATGVNNNRVVAITDPDFTSVAPAAWIISRLSAPGSGPGVYSVSSENGEFWYLPPGSIPFNTQVTIGQDDSAGFIFVPIIRD